MADRVITQIACWGAAAGQSGGGMEALYALCADGTVWRAARDRDAGGGVIWRQVPPISDAVVGEPLGLTAGPPQPELFPEVDIPHIVDEKQW